MSSSEKTYAELSKDLVSTIGHVSTLEGVLRQSHTAVKALEKGFDVMENEFGEL